MSAKKAFEQRSRPALAAVPSGASGGSALHRASSDHAELMQQVFEQFVPHFAPGAAALHVSHDASHRRAPDAAALAGFDISLLDKARLPDAVLYCPTRNWLFLIASAASVGPIDDQRRANLKATFDTAKAGLIFVTVFPNRQTMASFITDIAWETEVWCADNPSHLIHFNGDRFLGPH